MASVQFVGVSNVVQAFENKGLPYYAIKTGSNILEKNQDNTNLDEAVNQLGTFLEMINQGSNAIYTLCIYEEPGKITAKREADYSFNFKLNEPTMLPSTQQYQRGELSFKMDKLIEVVQQQAANTAALEQRLLQMENEEPEEEDNELIAGFFPKSEAVTIISGLINKFMDGTNKPTALAGTGEENNEHPAITRLRKALPKVDIDKVLNKLADKAEKNPSKLAGIIKMIDLL